MGLKAWNLKNWQAHLWGAWRVLESRVPTLKETANKQPMQMQHQNQQFEKQMGHTGGRVISSYQNVAHREKDHGKTPPGTKESAGAISLPLPPRKNNGHLWEQALCQYLLPNLFAPSPQPLAWADPPFPVLQVPTPRSPGHLSTTSPDQHILRDLSSCSSRGRSHFQGDHCTPC